MERKKRMRFDELDDAEKLEVMRLTVLTTLLLLKVARQSDYLTFNALIAGTSLESCIDAFEWMTGWNRRYERLAKRMAREFEEATAGEQRLDAKVHALIDVLYKKAGVNPGGDLVAYFADRTRKRRKKRAARE